jgi:ribosome-binding protein aMBF1 (putative translation factor)
MRTVTLVIDGEEFVAVSRADYLRFVAGKKDEGAVDALTYTLGALGRNLKAAREHAGLTQAELAKKLRKAQTTVSQSEAGKIRVSADYVERVLRVCGLPADWKSAPSRT